MMQFHVQPKNKPNLVLLEEKGGLNTDYRPIFGLQ